MTERLKYEGHLATLGKRKKGLEIEIEGLVKAMRENLDVLTRPEKLETDLIASQAMQLRNKQIDLKVINADIEKVNEILGRD